MLSLNTVITALFELCDAIANDILARFIKIELDRKLQKIRGVKLLGHGELNVIVF